MHISLPNIFLDVVSVSYTK